MSSLVYKATVDDKDPPPGVVLRELAALTESSREEIERIIDALLKRLDKDKPDIKYKTLCTIKHICLYGASEFREELQRYNQLIKDLLCMFQHNRNV